MLKLWKKLEKIKQVKYYFKIKSQTLVWLFSLLQTTNFKQFFDNPKIDLLKIFGFVIIDK